MRATETKATPANRKTVPDLTFPALPEKHKELQGWYDDLQKSLRRVLERHESALTGKGTET